MKFRQLSHDEIMDLLMNGIPVPKTVISGVDATGYYFAELATFINLADNDFYAVDNGSLSMTISFGDVEYLVCRIENRKIMFFMMPEIAENILDMTKKEANDVIGVIYGVIVYNERWEEIFDIAENFAENDLKLDSERRRRSYFTPDGVNNYKHKLMKKITKINTKYEWK